MAANKHKLSAEADPSGELKAVTWRHMRLVWERAQAGRPLTDEEACQAQAMREHPEYGDLWGQLDKLSDEEIERDGANPIMHVTIHSIVENQLAGRQDTSPEVQAEVCRAVEALTQRGLSRHEAIHRVGQVFSSELWHVLRGDRAFDKAGYVRKLKRLAAKTKAGLKP